MRSIPFPITRKHSECYANQTINFLCHLLLATRLIVPTAKVPLRIQQNSNGRMFFPFIALWFLRQRN